MLNNYRPVLVCINMLKILNIIIFCLFTQSVFAAEEMGNIKFLPDGDKSPNAVIEDVVWLQGSWRGQALGGDVEEIWSPPLGGSMMGSFKLVVGGVVRFYEFQTIAQVDGTLIFRLKHFNNDMTGWEEKDEVVEFKLVEVTDNKVYFNGLTIERHNDENITIYVAIENDGDISEFSFPYVRSGLQ